MTDDFPVNLAPRPVDMVHELHTAMYGESWARPESPARVWAALLAEVGALRETLRSQDRMHRLALDQRDDARNEVRRLRDCILEVADSMDLLEPDRTLAWEDQLRALIDTETP